ncbi:cob(I)yrinic acid a,c-diamide adenosyltransferase [Auraticoccus monumenti]|uniref:Corrinoid adenosyltransferase n=1 Tax=Auraticoccus monumenti TaxID=675864 RepID=A0A1G7AYE7_9ACTN|nr:cob(I)yrinic acid a,c-diamide adenosyltransferase [Auraticoccus monumenti]SDE19849.1 ATP:cob(I)alamin adenosyltransferase [Auraticoccus monumenti]
MVVISKVYTRTGDGGRTRLSDMSETSKTDPRVDAYGDVDEANSVIGVVLATGGLPDDVERVLAFLQNELFDLGADLSTPLVAAPAHPPLRVVQACVDRLEHWCDELGEVLPTLRSFVLPGGSPAAAHLHVARTVVRRAERRAWEAAAAHGTEPTDDGSPGGVNPVALTYLNRLSDLLFVLTRRVNGPDGEVLWVPGSDRATAAPQD